MVNKNGRSRRPIKAAESYGWVVESWEANEAYEMACEYFGGDDAAVAEVNSQIVGTLSSNELAECLAYLFRMWDFREWDERNEEDDEDYEDDYDESEDYE